MKSFKDFIKSNQLPTLVTIFGSHSSPNQKLKEDASAQQNKIGEHSSADEHKIHDNNKVETNNAVRRYAMSSAEMNGVLHTLHGNTDKPAKAEAINHNKKHIAALDDALKNSSIHSDTHVFTGLTHSPEKHFKDANTKKGESVVVHHPAYLSTSTSYDTAKFFASKPKNKTREKHVLKIEVPKGTKGGSIKHMASYPEENEVLLHRGHNIEIHPRPTIDSDGTHVWHAKVVSHTPKHIEG